MNHRKIFLIILETGISKFKVLEDSVSGPHLREEERKLTEISFIRALTPLMRAPHSRRDHLPKDTLPDIIKLGIRISVYRGDKSIPSVAILIL